VPFFSLARQPLIAENAVKGVAAMKPTYHVPLGIALGAAVIAWSPWTAVSLSAESQATQAASPPAACHLRIEGQAIERLTLVDESNNVTVLDRPGERVSVPAGKYSVREIRLQGGFLCHAFPKGEEDWIHVAPGQSPVIQAGAPLKPVLDVKRHGRALTLRYNLLDAAGRNYRKTERVNPPQFTVSRNGQTIGSGSFRFG
jgi:hypothetical protein